MMLLLTVVVGSMSAVIFPHMERLMITTHGLHPRNHSSLELLMVALGISLVYATAQRWTLRDRRGGLEETVAVRDVLNQRSEQEDGRHAA